MTALKLPVYEVIRKPSFPLLVGFRFENPEYGPVIDHMERGRKWGGVAWMLTIAKPHRPRTTGEKSQNHAINGFCQQIAMATHNDFQAIKMYMKTECISEGWGFTNLPSGDVAPISESEASTDQAAALIRLIKQKADEWGIRLIEE